MIKKNQIHITHLYIYVEEMKFHNFSMFSQKIYIYLQLSAEKNWIYLQEHQILQFLNNFWTFCQKKILNKFTNKTTQKFYTKMITSFIFISNKNFKFCNFLPKNLNLSLKTSIFHNFWTKFWTFCQTPGDLWQKTCNRKNTHTQKFSEIPQFSVGNTQNFLIFSNCQTFAKAWNSVISKQI